jgi:hypothetical protein
MRTKKRTGIRLVLATLALLFVATFVVLVAIRLITGKSLGLRSLVNNSWTSATSTVNTAWNGRAAAKDSQGKYTNIIFLHHSTGNNMILHGKVHDQFRQNGYIFYDHGFNQQGLRGPDGHETGYNYNVPADNTDPDGLLNIFRQPLLPVPVNTFSALMQHEVIIVKSCFAPGNNIASDAQLAQYQEWYQEIRGVMQAHPEKLYIIFTMPPLNPAETNPEEATRARKFSEWVNSDAFLQGSSNIAVFDFYTLLAENDPASSDYNMLRADYREGIDSHPISTANRAVAPVFVKFVSEKAEQFGAKIAGAK